MMRRRQSSGEEPPQTSCWLLLDKLWPPSARAMERREPEPQYAALATRLGIRAQSIRMSNRCRFLLRDRGRRANPQGILTAAPDIDRQRAEPNSDEWRDWPC